MTKVIELREQRAKLFKEAREILDTAEAEKRDLTAEEAEKYDRIMADIDKLEKDIERYERMEQLEKEFRTSDKEPIKPAVNSRDSQINTEYRDAFWKAMRQSVNALDANEFRSLKIGTAADGGYLVPTEFEKQLIDALAEQNIMRKLARVITTASDRKIPVVASHGTAVWLGEEGTFTESADQFNQVTLSAYKVGTLIKVSEELLNDSAFDLASYLANEFARRIGETEESAFVAGDGNGKPTGVITSAQVGVTTAVNNAITFDEIIDLYYSLKAPYRAKAAFVMNDATAKVIRKLKDSDGQYIWQPSVQAGEPDTLLGKPVYTTTAMPTIASQAKVITFGDFSYYWIADRQGRVFQRLNEVFAVNGQVGFRAYQRVDGKLILPEAVKVLQMAV